MDGDETRIDGDNPRSDGNTPRIDGDNLRSDGSKPRNDGNSGATQPEAAAPHDGITEAPAKAVQANLYGMDPRLFVNRQARHFQASAAITADLDQTYVVERILDHGPDDDGRLAFLMKWYGYPRAEATWEFPWSIDRNTVARYCTRKGIAVPALRL